MFTLVYKCNPSYPHTQDHGYKTVIWLQIIEATTNIIIQTLIGKATNIKYISAQIYNLNLTGKKLTNKNDMPLVYCTNE